MQNEIAHAIKHTLCAIIYVLNNKHDILKKIT